MRRRLVAALALLLLASAASAGAAERFASPLNRAVLRSGDTIRVAWDLDSTGGRFEEMELLLSLDGGRSFPLRLTRDLNPRTLALDWRVPALPASHARLALRAGDDGEPGDEAILLVSDEFSIAADPDSPLESTLAVRGEWRTREASDSGGTQAPIPLAFGATTPVLLPAPELPSAAAPRPRPLAEGSARRCAATLEETLTAPARPARPTFSRAPGEIPRRE